MSKTTAMSTARTIIATRNAMLHAVGWGSAAQRVQKNLECTCPELTTMPTETESRAALEHLVAAGWAPRGVDIDYILEHWDWESRDEDRQFERERIEELNEFNISRHREPVDVETKLMQWNLRNRMLYLVDSMAFRMPHKRPAEQVEITSGEMLFGLAGSVNDEIHNENNRRRHVTFPAKNGIWASQVAWGTNTHEFRKPTTSIIRLVHPDAPANAATDDVTTIMSKWTFLHSEFIEHYMMLGDAEKVRDTFRAQEWSEWLDVEIEEGVTRLDHRGHFYEPGILTVSTHDYYQHAYGLIENGEVVAVAVLGPEAVHHDCLSEDDMEDRDDELHMMADAPIVTIY